MDKGSLESVLQKTHSLKSLVAGISYQLLWGLSYLHYERMIHRDVKPSNILLSSGGCVKLGDFGIAANSTTTQLHTTVVGTTKFFSPERLRGLPYGRASDLWSLGLVLWQCVTGCEPWPNVHSLVDLVVTVEETDVEQELIPTAGILQPGLSELLVACLQKEPGTSCAQTRRESRCSSGTPSSSPS